MSKVTEWFPGDVQPEHIGVYETLIASDRGFQYWTGVHWGRTSNDPERAAQMALTPSYFQQPHWRGLTSDPSKEPS
jgi:hypothetical protein